jgi:hypothetical protein
MSLLQTIEAEIEASNKQKKPVNVQLVKEGDAYKAFINFDLNGEFLLSANDGEIESLVQVETVDNKLTVFGLDCQQQVLHASLSKDESAILRAIAKKTF